jgi:uncharacterized RmlC-like cupin family protein
MIGRRCALVRPGEVSQGTTNGVPHLPVNGNATESAVAVLARTDASEQESSAALPELDQLPHLRGTAER